MYHSQCEVFIYNVANCQLLFYFHSIEDVRNCQEEELYQGTGHGKAVGWVEAAVNTRRWPSGSSYGAATRLWGTTAPRVCLSKKQNLLHSGCTGDCLDEKKAELKTVHVKYIRETVN